MEAGPGGQNKRGGRFAREASLVVFVVIGLAMVSGAYWLWQMSGASTTREFLIVAEQDPTAEGESSAQLLLAWMRAEVQIQGGDGAAKILEPGTTRGKISGSGKALRRSLEDGRLEAVLVHPQSDNKNFELSLRVPRLEDGRLLFELSMDEADAFLRRTARTTVAVRDASKNPVAGLRSSLGLPCNENADRAGLYELGMSFRSVLFELHGNNQLQFAVQDPEANSVTLELEPAWFLSSDQASRIVTAAYSEALSPLEARRQREALAVERAAFDAAIDAQRWDDAATSLAKLSQLPGMTDIVQLQSEIDAGRARVRRAARAVEAAQLLAQEARDAEAEQERLAAEAVREAAQAVEEPAADLTDPEPTEVETATLPVAELPVTVSTDEQIRQLLDQYVQSQNQFDLALYGQVYPSVASGDARSRVERGWSNLKSQRLNLDIRSITVDGDRAEVVAWQTLDVAPRVGSSFQRSAEAGFSLVRVGDQWLIDSKR